MDAKLTIDKFGNKLWSLNGKVHREDGPAAEYADGKRHWFAFGVLHREDGPAIELPEGIRCFYLNGKKLTPDEFLEKTPRKVDALFNLR
jgi:hypothetical protein